MESKKNKAQAATLESLFFFLKGLFSEAAPGGQAYLISVTFHVSIPALPLPVITVFLPAPMFYEEHKKIYILSEWGP